MSKWHIKIEVSERHSVPACFTRNMGWTLRKQPDLFEFKQEKVSSVLKDSNVSMKMDEVAMFRRKDIMVWC